MAIIKSGRTSPREWRTKTVYWREDKRERERQRQRHCKKEGLLFRGPIVRAAREQER